MKRIVLLSVISSIIVLIQSCGDAQPGTGLLPNVSGSSGEVVVVIDKARWDGPLGDKFREVLGSPLSMPQAEAQFDLVSIGPDAFGKFYLTHRNVIMISTGPDKETKATFQNNTYSYSQLIINLQAKNDEELMKLLDEQRDALAEKINIAERDRWIGIYKKSLNSMNFNKLRDEHGISLHVPANYALEVDEKGFVWLAYETTRASQAILIHYFPYNGENYFNKDSIKSIRNNMTRTKVEGPAEGSYMTIEDRVPVDYRTFRFRDRNYAEMRGLWTLENGFMGGPFVTLVTKDEVNNRFIMLDGFVYAPGEEKRELLRQVEAILYTVIFPDETEIVITADKPEKD